MQFTGVFVLREPNHFSMPNMCCKSSCYKQHELFYLKVKAPQKGSSKNHLAVKYFD